MGEAAAARATGFFAPPWRASSTAARFTFGIPELTDKVELVALAMGLFGVADFLRSVNRLHFVGNETKVRLRDMRPFRTGQPDNGGGDENCVQLKSDGLDDDQCDESHDYICECDGRASLTFP